MVSSPFFTLKNRTYVLISVIGGLLLSCNNCEVCMNRFEDYRLRNKEFFENRLIRSFLAHPTNLILLQKVICEPTDENKLKLDRAFKSFYFNLRFTSYISSSIYFTAINFDKKHKKTQSRHPLTVDKPIGDGEEGTFKDLITDNTVDMVDNVIQTNHIQDYLEDPILIEAVDTLTNKQQEILYLSYVCNLSDTEISRMLKKSQQAISKSHKKAIEKMFEFIQKRKDV